MLLPIHVAAGAIALLLGAIALSVKKGGPLHRRSGMLFVYAMLVMGFTAGLLGDIGASVLTAYFTGTALMTVRPPSAWTRRTNIIALVVAVALALGTLLAGVNGLNKPGLSPGGVPFRTIGAMSLILAAVLVLAAIGDLRVMRSGIPRGAPRLRRHLWRMCFALFIAAGSFFSIEERVAKVLPDPFTTGPMRLLPILLLFGTMFYWMWRLRRPNLPRRYA